ncbi:MAG: hypothetical protein C4540_01055 [Candidatus Omnitrophota bacterium]|jgi:hypothetical protein|nr:MAG: hypothetical protein C4540_01055 [Candidatus Omnitrophota bacterium]
MNKRTISELIITGFLVVVLFFSAKNSVEHIRKAKKERKPRQAIILPAQGGQYLQRAAPKEKSIGEAYAELEEEGKKWKLKKDPFTGEGIVSQEGATSVIVLSGIFWDGSCPMAIVNDAVISIGDTVDGYLVTDIRQDRVILRKGAKDLELQWD